MVTGEEVVEGKREEGQAGCQAHLHGGHELCPLTQCHLAAANVPNHKDTAMGGLLQVETVLSGMSPTKCCDTRTFSGDMIPCWFLLTGLATPSLKMALHVSQGGREGKDHRTISWV